VSRPLLCPRCHAPADVIERVTGALDWGPAVIGADGVVRPATRSEDFARLIDSQNGDVGAAYGHCGSTTCGHQWKLRRPFDPMIHAAPAPTSGKGESRD
jgi:hypothetical protein